MRLKEICIQVEMVGNVIGGILGMIHPKKQWIIQVSDLALLGPQPVDRLIQP